MRAVLQPGRRQIHGAGVYLGACGHINAVKVDLNAVEVDARIVLCLSAGGGAVIVNRLKGKAAGGKFNGFRGHGLIGRALCDRVYDGIQGIVCVGAVDELEIIHKDVARALGAVLRRGYADGIAALHVDRELQRGNVGLDPDPALARPVGQCAAAALAVFVIAVILEVGGRTAEILSGNEGHRAVVLKLSVSEVGGLRGIRAADKHRLDDGIVIRVLLGDIHPHTHFRGLDRVDIDSRGEAEVGDRD